MRLWHARVCFLRCFILTSHAHILCAEGFGLEEVGERLEAITRE